MQGFGPRVLLALLGASLACGGRAKSDDETPPRPDVVRPDVGEPDVGGLDPRPPDYPVSSGNPGSTPPPSYDSPDPTPDPATEPASLITDFLFWQYCTACHAAPPAGFEPNRFQFGDDLDVIVRLGLIVPLDSGSSRIVQVIQDGSMPPPGITPRPSAVELQQLIDLIDDPRYWTDEWTEPDVEPPPEPVFDAGPPALPADAGTSD